MAIGRDTGDRNLTALATETHGRILVALDRVPEGVRLLDDAMVSVIGGELDQLFTGWIFCEVLSVCRDLGDLPRAREWTDAAMRWCAGIGEGRVYSGICRVHRGELECLRGAWAVAEAEIKRACDELSAVDPRYAGEAFYLAGEIRRLRGDHAAAEQAYRRAHELGHPPQPGLALVRLAQGRVDTAVAALRRGQGPSAPTCSTSSSHDGGAAAGPPGAARASTQPRCSSSPANRPHAAPRRPVPATHDLFVPSRAWGYSATISSVDRPSAIRRRSPTPGCQSRGCRGTPFITRRSSSAIDLPCGRVPWRHTVLESPPSADFSPLARSRLPGKRHDLGRMGIQT